MSDVIGKRIFNNTEEAKVKLGWDVTIPKDLPEGCNMVRYDFNGDHCFCKTVKSNLYLFTCNNWLCLYNSLENLIDYEESLGYYYVSIRVSQKDDKDKFTPERLLGVETTEGFVTYVFNSWTTGRLFINATNCRNLLVSEVDYYVSDDSDETVSFDEYVDMFYER